MTEPTKVEMKAQLSSLTTNHRASQQQARRKRSRRNAIGMAAIAGATILTCAGALIWLLNTATTIKTELKATQDLVPRLKSEVQQNDFESLGYTVGQIQAHTTSARKAASNPIWTLASTLPWIGPNLQATSEAARAADDVATLGAAPLVEALHALNWETLIPSGGKVNVTGIGSVEPAVTSAAYAISSSHDRLAAIKTDDLMEQVAIPINVAREELRSLRVGLNAASAVAKLGPPMLAQESRRHYLLIIQNNAESRASGGIPGALAILTVENGKLSLNHQISAGGLDIMIPPLTVDPEQEHIYSARIGKFVQDANLTPDFPTAATTAQTMWKKKTGLTVDGVISVDPIALSYILQATGPVDLGRPQLAIFAHAGLPTELTGANIVPTLLSDVYAKIEQPELQDAYFAAVAKEIFTALSSGKSDAKGLISGMTRAVEEGRIYIWSSRRDEQSVIAAYALSGSVAGPSVLPAQFGVYFNDGTGAKMDYYVKRTVQLVRECPRDGYESTTLRITSTNTAPSDAAGSLPPYVTGGGNFGVPPGSVQTNIVTYGPVQAQVEYATVEGKRTNFAPYFHSNRPVGVLAIRLAPGESKAVEFTFGKIVQHAEPNVVVTPTVQPVKEVILPMKQSVCG